MVYAPARLILDAANALVGANPLVVVTIPAILREGVAENVDITKDQVEFGSTAETRLLKDFFELPSPPDPDRPWRALWEDGLWVKRKYPGGTLQRIRTDQSGRGRVFTQTKVQHGTDRWGITSTAGHDLREGREQTFRTVRLIDLALWFGRNIDTDTLPEAIGTADTPLDRLEKWFIDQFGPHRGDLVGTLYEDDVPDHYRAVEFADTPVGEDTYVHLGSLPASPSVAIPIDEVVDRLEDRIRAAGYQLPAGLVRRVLGAWLRGDFVILVGQPGTGKSLFANCLGRAMEAEFDLDPPLLISVTADYDEAEFIGYERLDGQTQYRDFATQVLLAETPLEARVVVLEEFNLASIETYMASILVAAQEQDRLVRLPSGDRAHLPIDTFFMATCNSFRDEPETRTRVSSPTKRRSTTITMPNILGDRFEEDPETAIRSLILPIVDQERARVDHRAATGLASQFDSLRSTALNSVEKLGDFSGETIEGLEDVCAAILNTSSGRSWFTLGLLRDVVLEIVMANRDKESELMALGTAVADKLVHQLRGDHTDVEELLNVTATLPNAGEIARLIDLARTGPADELLPLL